MIYHILVKPHSNKDEVIEIDGQLVIKTRKKPHDGEANTAVIELLSGYLGVPKSQITIKSGATGRFKTIEV